MSEPLDQGYLALPSTEQPAPAILVLPAWWGLNTFFRDVCDRLAGEGFVVFAPDLYNGQVAETIDQAKALSNELDMTQTIKRLADSVAALRQHPRANGEPISVIGFSLGAFLGLSLLEELPDQLGALVIFYGTRSGYGTYYKSPVAVLGHFAENDEFEPSPEPQNLETALKAVGIATKFYTYPGTEHWFFEANQPNAYKAEVAALAWERTVSFLKDLTGHDGR